MFPLDWKVSGSNIFHSSGVRLGVTRKVDELLDIMFQGRPASPMLRMHEVLIPASFLFSALCANLSTWACHARRVKAIAYSMHPTACCIIVSWLKIGGA